MCPRVIDMLLQQKDESTTIHVSALEVYFDDCFDLLQNKIQIQISGFGKGAKSAAIGYSPATAARDKDGKWIPPWIDGKWNPAL
jgi:hypothetical protein